MTTPREALLTGVSPNGAGPPLEDEARAGDIALAEFFVKDHAIDGRYVPDWKTWCFWDDTRFKRDGTGEALRRAQLTVRGLYAAAGYGESAKDRAALVKHAQKADQRRRIEAMLALAAVSPVVVVLPDRLDADPWTLNVLNGTIDLTTGALRPHRRADLITKLAPVLYDPEAQCLTWLAFLARIMGGDEGLIRFLQRAIGYSLTGSTREQVFFLLYGSGSNGKSTLLTTVREMLGDYALGVDVETLLASKRPGQGASPDIVRLRGARFATAVETTAGRRLAEGLVKRLTGGDVIVGRDLYQPGAQEFIASLKLFLSANHRPIIRGTDHAIWRRVRLVPFTVTIPESEQDRQLAEKLRAEWPGILRWAVEGSLAWQRDGLGTSEAVRRATVAYRDEQDPLGAFLRDRCRIDPIAASPAGPLFEAYQSWCQDSGDMAISETAFGRALGERGFAGNRTKHGRYRLGLRLLEPGETTQPGDGLGPVTGSDGYLRNSPYARAGEEFIELPDTTRHPSPEGDPERVTG